MFADDCFISYRATIRIARPVKNILEHSSKVSSQTINYHISKVSVGVPSSKRKKLAEIENIILSNLLLLI